MVARAALLLAMAASADAAQCSKDPGCGQNCHGNGPNNQCNSGKSGAYCQATCDDGYFPTTPWGTGRQANTYQCVCDHPGPNGDCQWQNKNGHGLGCARCPAALPCGDKCHAIGVPANGHPSTDGKNCPGGQWLYEGKHCEAACDDGWRPTHEWTLDGYNMGYKCHCAVGGCNWQNGEDDNQGPACEVVSCAKPWVSTRSK